MKILQDNKPVNKENMYIVHHSGYINFKGKDGEADYYGATINPIIPFRSIEEFFANRDVLMANAQLLIPKGQFIDAFLLPYYTKDGKANVNYHDFLIVYGDKIKSVFPDIDLSLLVNVAELEEITKMNVLHDDSFIDNRMLIDACNLYLRKCNILIDKLHKLNGQKFTVPSQKSIAKVKAEKFTKLINKGVGFGNANFFELKSANVVFDFGGTNYKQKDFSAFLFDKPENYIILSH